MVLIEVSKVALKIRLPILLLALAALSCGPPEADVAPARLTIFATIFPLAEIVREVGGERVSVDWLVELGKPLDGFTMTRRERERMNSTDFTLCDSFRRSETWAAMDLVRRQDTGHVISADKLPVSTSEPSQGLLYLDPIVARQLAPVLADAFSKIKPQYGDYFHEHAAAFVNDLDQLIGRYPNTAFKNQRVVVLGNVLNPLLGRFGIESVMLDLDAYRLSDADLSAVRKAASEAGAAAVLVPFDLPPGAVNRIEEQSGLKAFAMDAAGLTAFKGHDTYLGILAYNLEQLRAATSAKETGAAK